MRALNTHSIETVNMKVHVGHLAPPARPLPGYLGRLPLTDGADDLAGAVRALETARRHRRPIVLGMGAHPIKVGVGPLLCQLIREGYVTHLAMNGATAIHDAELALFGTTSEDVQAAMLEGRFGMHHETPDFLLHELRHWENQSFNARQSRNTLGLPLSQLRDGAPGLGTAWGRALYTHRAPHGDISVLETAYLHGVPVSVHPALGTDILHMHAGAPDWERLGRMGHFDFRLLVESMRSLGGDPPGVLWNLGSAVVLPEVFLKALAILTNQGANVQGWTAIDCDMQSGYRQQTRVVAPARWLDGRGYALTGRHELLLPLLTGLLLAEKELPDANPTPVRRERIPEAEAQA